MIKESVYKQDQCGVCGSPNVVRKSVFVDEVENFMQGQPVMFATRRDPNTMRLLMCDDCKAVFHDNKWVPLATENRAQCVVNTLLETDDADVSRYVSGLKDNVYNPDEQLKLESFLRWNTPDQFLVITTEDGYHLDVWRGDGEKRHHYGPFGFTQLREMKQQWPECRWLNFPVRETEDVDADVQRYLAMVKAHPQLRRFSKEEIKRFLAQRAAGELLRREPEPPSEPHQIVGEAIGDVPDPEPSSSEVNRLLPTKTYHLKGNSMIHAPGVIRMAQTEWRSGRKKQKEWALGVVKAWEGLPEKVYLAILNGQVEMETNGDDAVITFKDY